MSNTYRIGLFRRVGQLIFGNGLCKVIRGKCYEISLLWVYDRRDSSSFKQSAIDN